MVLHLLRQICFISALSLLFFSPSLAQKAKVASLSPEKHITQFSIDTWGTEQGLPSKSLLYMKQTSDGYLWISSFQGLFRFDGVNFEIFNTKNNSDFFKTNSIKNLYEKPDGTLFISTSGSGLITFKNGVFKKIGHPNASIEVTLFDSPSHAWIGTKAQGVFHLNDTTFTPFTEIQALNDVSVFSIFKDSEENLWFATEGNGVVKRSKNGEHTVFTTKNGLSSDKVRTIYQDSQKRIWVGTNTGVCYFDGKKMQLQKGTENHPVNRIVEDYYGGLWMASDKGLLRLNPKSKEVEILTEKNGLPHKNVQDVVIDMEGSLWFATYRAGLGRLTEGKFSNYTTRTGLASKSISAIHEIGENEYLAATDVGIVNRIKNNKITRLNFKTKLPNDRLKHLNSDSKGNILISTYSGLLVIHPDGKETLYNMKNGLLGNQTRMTLEDHLGNIWVGSRSNGLTKIAPDGTFSYYNRSNSDLSSNFAMSLRLDKKNRLLMGSNDAGLDVIVIDNNTFKVTNYKDGITSKLIFNTYADSDNVIWITTNAGINRLEKGKITQITTKNGLLTDICFDIVEDDLGYFWITSSDGIMQVPKQELNDFAEGKIDKIATIKMFGQADGMVTRECTGASFSIKTKSGKLMFPTLSGITFIDPTHIPINQIKPPVAVQSLVVDNQEIDIYNPIALEPDKQRFIFYFTALSLIAPKNVSFKYKLENYDKDWITSKGERQAIYTGLPYGEYIFKVKAANNDGIWNEEGDSISFEIKPHFYERPIFYIVAVLLLAFIVYRGVKIRTQQIVKANEELEATVRERTFEILTQQKELLTQRDQIQTQNTSLELAYNDISMLSKIGQEITATLDFEKLYEILYESVNKLMKADGFGVGMYNENEDTLDFESYIENGEKLPFLAEKLTATNSFAVKCFKEQEVIFVDDLDNEKKYKNISNEEDAHGLVPHSLIYVPLLFENKAIGVVTVQSFDKNVYIERHITILQTLASYISIGLANVKSFGIIQHKNEQITDSIRYAEKIQQAVLPSQRLITNAFDDAFTIFSPKDIVSGDFYWFNQIDNKMFVAVADCTGHGVPGAFMSMIGMASLNEIVNKEQIFSPADILTNLHKKIRKSLKQEEAANDDGMDIALCLIEKIANGNVRITFSGAKRPLYYSENEQLRVLKGNKKSIGGLQREEERVFTEEGILLPKGESIYIFSDGIVDQNAPNRKKFGTPRLEKIIKENIASPLNKQKTAIVKALETHQDGDPQRDDIVMVGIKF